MCFLFVKFYYVREACINCPNQIFTDINRFPQFGKKYQLKFTNDNSAETRCLVHFPSFIRFVSILSTCFEELELIIGWYANTAMKLLFPFIMCGITCIHKNLTIYANSIIITCVLCLRNRMLTHISSVICLVRLAREAGLEYVEIQNLTEFYDDNRFVDSLLYYKFFTDVLSIEIGFLNRLYYLALSSLPYLCSFDL